MPDNTPSAPAPGAAGEPSPTSSHAVTQCSDAWMGAYQAELANGGNKVSAIFRAARAYRSAMPPLVGSQNICDFIACTAHGLLLGAIEDSQSTKLLYAAQVALGAIRSQPKAPSSSPAS